MTAGLWEGERLCFLREALLEIKEQWSELCPGFAQCPIDFSVEELTMHAEELENQADVGSMLRLFRDSWNLPPNGMVIQEELSNVSSPFHAYT